MDKHNGYSEKYFAMKAQNESSRDRFYEKYQIFQSTLDSIKVQKKKLEVKKEENNLMLSKLFLFTDEYNLKVLRSYRIIRRERQLQQIKASELVKLTRRIKGLEIRIKKTEETNSKMYSYMLFLQQALKTLPDDYIKSSKDQSIEGLIGRFKSLLDINDALYAQMITLGDVVRKYIDVVDELKFELSTKLVDQSVYYMKQLQESNILKDHMTLKHFEYFQHYFETREKIHRLGITFLAIDNITNKCIRQFKSLLPIEEFNFNRHPNIKDMTVEAKISSILDWIIYRIELISELARKYSINNPFIRRFIRDEGDSIYNKKLVT